MTTLDTVSKARSRLKAAGATTYRTLSAMLGAAHEQRARSTETVVPAAPLLWTADGGRLGIEGPGGWRVDGLTDWATRQAGSLAGVPAPVLDRLTASTAARVLNETFPRKADDGTALAFQALTERTPEGGSTLRALTSPGYRRLWDATVLEDVARWLAPNGWQPAFPTINHGGTPEAERERALWRSDREAFTFFMGPRGTDDDGLGGLRRGLFVGNSEVGARSLLWGTFWFRDVCANFLVWDASEVSIRRHRHTANVVREASTLRRWIRDAVPEVVTAAELEPFRALAQVPFKVDAPKGGDASKDPWEERFAREVAARIGVTQATGRKAAEVAVVEAGGRTVTYWDAVNGLTAAARDMIPGDRFDVAMAAGRLASRGLALTSA